MSWRFLAIVFAALVLNASPMRAEDGDWKDCGQSANPDRSIAGCTRVLERGASETSKYRAVAFYNRGYAYDEKGDLDRAIADYDQAIQLNPKDALAFNNRGWAYERKGDHDRAIADFDHAIRLNPKDAIAFNVRGIAYRAKNDLDRAIADYASSIRLNPQNANAFNNRGVVYLTKGDYRRAIADFDAAIRLNSKDAVFYYDRGNAYDLKGDHDRAITDYSQAIWLDPQYASAFNSRGSAYRAKEDYDRALADYDAAIRLNPKNADFYCDPADVYAFKGDYDRALANYDAALRLDPQHAKALANREAVRAAKLAEKSSRQPPREAATAPKPEPAAAPPPVVAASETRVALVIGNARYEAQSPLKNPHNDAAAIAAALRKAGFKTVTVAENLSRDALVKALQEFQDKADAADWALIYFSGHGMEASGVNYVLPTDARLKTDRNIADEAVSLNRLMDSVSGARKLHMVILDACRDNPFAHQMQRMLASKSVTRGLAPVEPSRATLVVYAARDGQLAQDGDGDNSPFAASLAKHLVEPHVEVTKLFRLVTDDVLYATERRQQPFVYGSLPGSEDFYFRP